MNRARKWSFGEAQAERNYINSVDPQYPGPSFNHSPACFAKYCDMQKNQAAHSGHLIIATDMTQARNDATSFAS